MTDTLIVGLITSIATILGAFIGAFGAIEAAKAKIRSGEGGVSCTLIVLVASDGALGGLLIGAFLRINNCLFSTQAFRVQQSTGKIMFIYFT